MLETGSFESFVSLVTVAVGRFTRQGQDSQPQHLTLVQTVLEAAASTRPAWAAFAFGRFLVDVRSASLKPAARVDMISLCCAWFDNGGLEASVTALVCGAQLPAEAADACVRWMCSLVDLIAPLSEGLSKDAVPWLSREHHAAALVSALMKAWHRAYHASTDGGHADSFLARLALRGEATRLGARLCTSCLQCDTDTTCGFGGVVLASAFGADSAAACSVVDAVLEASAAVLYIKDCV